MKFYFYFFLFLISSNYLQSQTKGEIKKLSLMDCYEIALEKNLDLKLSNYQKNLSEAELKFSKNAYL